MKFAIEVRLRRKEGDNADQTAARQRLGPRSAAAPNSLDDSPPPVCRHVRGLGDTSSHSARGRRRHSLESAPRTPCPDWSHVLCAFAPRSTRQMGAGPHSAGRPKAHSLRRARLRVGRCGPLAKRPGGRDVEERCGDPDGSAGRYGRTECDSFETNRLANGSPIAVHAAARRSRREQSGARCADASWSR